MTSQEYWAKREAEQLKHYITDEAEYSKEINRIYANMLDSCNEQINAFYGRYASKEGITLAEAKKAVKAADIKAYERKAKRYVKDKDFSPKANEEMRLYNATMRINRLEMLKANIGLELISGHEELNRFMGDILKDRTEEELARQAGILGKTIRNNANLAHAIPNASFHNATFSDRIWLYQDLMKSDLDKLLQNGLLQGKNPRQLARELEKYVMEDATGGAKYRALTLMQTELARVQTEAQKQSFERNGFDEYEFIANSGCCADCQAINGKHFKVSKMMPGVNAPPMHPRCRCSTAAYSDRKEYEEWLNFLEKGGTTESWENRLKINFAGSNKSYKRSLLDIAEGKAGLNKKRQSILNKLKESGAVSRYDKGTISTRDLAYLSAATKNEFALFRSKKEDIIIRGTAKSCDVAGELADEITNKKYEWVAHSHVDMGNLTPSQEDRITLMRLGQKKSIIVGIDGEEVVFYQSPFDY